LAFVGEFHSVESWVVASCGSINFGEVQPQDLCKCTPLEPNIADFRHDEKHVPIPTVTPVEITVDTILSFGRRMRSFLPTHPELGANKQQIETLPE
jgi:hypothetical protein